MKQRIHTRRDTERITIIKDTHSLVAGWKPFHAETPVHQDPAALSAHQCTYNHFYLDMKRVLKEEWARITIDEINTEIAKLPKIMELYVL